MKKKYIPLAKQSKKNKKEHAASQREGWGDIKPTVRIVESRKTYSRKRMKPIRPVETE